MRLLALGTALLLLAGCVTAPPLGVPGASAGVAFNGSGEAGSFADGIADPTTGRAVTADDPARVASVSKLVTTIGALRLIEDGKLSLDADISDALGFRFRNPHLPDVPITLRMLLSHTSSLREHDDNYVIPLGATLQGTVADPLTWDQAHPPGAWFHYTNLNFPVVASAMERVTGERFDRLMQRLVLAPLRIDACYNWPTCSDQAVRRAVVLTRGADRVKDDLGGRQPDCPVFVRDGDPCDLSLWRAGENGSLFSPQGGLRISARGLARIGRLLLGKGEVDGVRILSPQSVAEMMTPRFQAAKGTGDAERFYCFYGLATHRLASGTAGCDDDPAGDGVPRVGHAGEAYGLRSGLWIDPGSRTGIAYFLTNQPDSVPGNASMSPAEARTFRRTLALLRR